MIEAKKENFKAGKSISLEANKRLKEIQKILNQGGFKKKYNERDIISEAVICFRSEDIERMKKDRASGEETMMSVLKEIYEKEGSGTEISFDEFLKKNIAPMLSQKKIKKKKETLKEKTTSGVSL